MSNYNNQSLNPWVFFNMASLSSSAADNLKSCSGNHHSRDDDDNDLQNDLPTTKRAKTGWSEFNYEEENATLRAALHAAREEAKAAREEAKAARENEFASSAAVSVRSS